LKKHPNIEQLKKMTEDDLFEENLLLNYVFAVIEKSALGKSFDEKVKHAVELSLTKNSSRYYFITTFLGMWGNGGMQHVLLCDSDEISLKQWQLKQTVEAFRYYGCKDTADFLTKLVLKSKTWSSAIDELYIRELKSEDVKEKEFEQIWGEVDKFDELFGKGFPSDPNVYKEIIQDIRTNPESYVRKW